MMSKVPTLEELEKAAIREALRQTDTRAEAAKALGISARTLYRKMNKYEDLRPTNLGFGGSRSGEGLISSLMDD